MTAHWTRIHPRPGGGRFATALFLALAALAWPADEAKAQAPTLVSAVMASASTMNLTFDRPLDRISVPASRFTVTVDGTAIPASAWGVRISNVSEYVRLWIPSSRHWVEVGQIVTLSYTDPNAGDDAKVLQSKGGVDVASFGPVDVTNNSTLKRSPRPPNELALHKYDISAELLFTWKADINLRKFDDHYEVQWSRNGSEWLESNIDITGDFQGYPQTQYDLTGLCNGHRYWVRVRAVRDGLKSGWAAPKSEKIELRQGRVTVNTHVTSYSVSTNHDFSRGSERNPCMKLGETGTGAPPEVIVPLTVSVESQPVHHDGESAFEVRLSFSEALKNKQLGRKVVRVTNGTNTGSTRLEDDGEVWAITIEPDGGAEVTIALVASETCGSGIACTADYRPLSEALEVTVPGPQPATTPGVLTGWFVDIPTEHDGESAFPVRIAFSEGLKNKKLGHKVVRVTNGTNTGSTRLAGDDEIWTITVEPDGTDDVTIALAASEECGSGIACTKEDRRPLSEGFSQTVKGPAGITVADAEAAEAPGATVDFTVSLSRPAIGAVTVDYATTDGTAKKDEDYTGTSGTLTFLPREQTKTVSVPILEDAISDDGETFTLTLSNATGGYISDATATGTITESASKRLSPVAESAGTPDGYALAAAYPNPFNPAITIEFSVPRDGPVRIEVFNAAGQRLSSLVDEALRPGTYKTMWDGLDLDGRRVSSGVYFYRMQAGDFVSTRAMTLLK